VRPVWGVPARSCRSGAVPSRAIRSRSRTLALVLLAACADEPSRVYVPAPSLTESLRAWTEQGDSATVRVGETLVLHAESFSGPWIEVDRDSLDADACWVVSPPVHEEEVASSLRWHVDPSGAALFDTALRLDRSREVRFTSPGVYALTPESSSWCADPYTGNVLHVVVRP